MWYVEFKGEPNSRLLVDIAALQEAREEYQSHMTPTPGGNLAFVTQPQPSDPIPTYYAEYNAQFQVVMERWTLPHQVVEIRERDPVSSEMGPWRAYEYMLDSEGKMDSYICIGECLERCLFDSLLNYYTQ